MWSSANRATLRGCSNAISHDARRRVVVLLALVGTLNYADHTALPTITLPLGTAGAEQAELRWHNLSSLSSGRSEMIETGNG